LRSTLSLYVNDYPRALSDALEALATATREGIGFLCMMAGYFSSWSLLHLGEWGVLNERLTAGIREAELNANPFATTSLTIFRAGLHLEAQDFAGAWWLCHQAAPRKNDHYNDISLRMMAGRALLGLGRIVEAQAYLEAFAAELDAGGRIELRYRTMLDAARAECALRSNDVPAARAAAMDLLGLAGPPGNRHYLALAHRLLARCAMAENHRQSAESHLTDALAALEPGPLPLAAWRVHATAAELCRQLGRKTEGRQHDEQASAVLQSLAASLGDDPEAEPLRRGLLRASPLYAATRASLHSRGEL
jgi:hypothetical protein